MFILTTLFIILTTSTILCSTFLYLKYKEALYNHNNWQGCEEVKNRKISELTQCNQNKERLDTNIASYKQDILNLQSSVSSYKNQLTSCQNELNQFKNSGDYYYSQKIIIDNTIKAIAAQNIENFEKKPSCLRWDQQWICTSTYIGICIDGYYQNFCAKYDEGKRIYESISFDGWKDAYMARAIISNYEYVRDHYSYSLGGSPKGSGAQTSIETFNIGAGKCDEQSILLVALLRSVGVEAYLFSIPEENHITTAISFQKLPGKYYTNYLLLDPVCDWCDIDEYPDWNLDNARIMKYYSFASK